MIHAGQLETGHTGRLPNWAIVEDYIRSEWVSQVDETVKFWATKTNVDCRYQRAERDEESTVVYDFCVSFKQEKFVNPVMGFGRKRMKQTPYRRVKPLAGDELVRYNINVDLYKDRAWETLHNPKIKPGARYMHLPVDLPDDILRQLYSEEQIQVDGLAVWKVKDGFTDNHAWDCDIYADMAAELLGVLGLKNIDAVTSVLKKRETKRRQEAKRDRPEDHFQDGIPDIV